MSLNFTVPSTIVSIIGGILGLLLVQILWKLFRGGRAARDERGPIATATIVMVVLVIFLDAVNHGPLSTSVTGTLANLLASPLTFITGLVPTVVSALVVILVYHLLFDQGKEMEAFVTMFATVLILVLYYDLLAKGPIYQAIALRLADIIAGR